MVGGDAREGRQAHARATTLRPVHDGVRAREGSVVIAECRGLARQCNGHHLYDVAERPWLAVLLVLEMDTIPARAGPCLLEGRMAVQRMHDLIGDGGRTSMEPKP